jgi:hypothetical protein
VQLLEYDKRFEQHGSEFTFYDYNRPEELPSELKHAFRIVVADPPYLVSLYSYMHIVWNLPKKKRKKEKKREFGILND